MFRLLADHPDGPCDWKTGKESTCEVQGHAYQRCNVNNGAMLGDWFYLCEGHLDEALTGENSKERVS